MTTGNPHLTYTKYLWDIEMISSNIFVLPGPIIEGPMTGILFASIILYHCIHYHLFVALLNGGNPLSINQVGKGHLWRTSTFFFRPKKILSMYRCEVHQPQKKALYVEMGYPYQQKPVGCQTARHWILGMPTKTWLNLDNIDCLPDGFHQW